MSQHRSTLFNLLFGLLLIGFGVLFLIGQIVRVDVFHYLWPFFIVSLGLIFFAGMVAGGRDSDSGFLAIPACILTMLGLIFFYQVVSGHWASWAYAWLLLAPTSVGIGLMISAWWSRHPALWPVGVALTGFGLVFFVVVGGLFELLLGLAGVETPARVLWPVMLILLGLFILFGRGFRWFVYPVVVSGFGAGMTSNTVPAKPAGAAPAEPSTPAGGADRVQE